MKKLLIIFTLGMGLLGCSEKKNGGDKSKEGEVFPSVEQQTELILNETDAQTTTSKFLPPEIKADEEVSKPTPSQSTTIQKKIIHTADIRFKVEEFKKAESAIKARVQAIGGYISNSNQNRQSGNLENTWTVRIPAEKFDIFLGDVEKQSIYIHSKNISAEDVTAEYVDNELRIKSKQKVLSVIWNF